MAEPYIDEQSGNICITLSKAIYNGDSIIDVAGMDMYMDDLVTLIDIVKVLNESFTEINEQVATVLQYSENLSETSENAAISSHLGTCAQALKDKIAEFQLKNHA